MTIPPHLFPLWLLCVIVGFMAYQPAPVPAYHWVDMSEAAI